MSEPTVSYQIRVADDATAPEMEFVDVRVTRDGLTAVRARVADSILWIPADESFAERYDVIRRVSAPKPSDDALSYVVTFVNHRYRTPGGRAPRHQVELWSAEPLDVTVEMEGMAFAAAAVWPESGWAGDDEPDWWVENITTPEGDLVKPEM